MICSHLPSHIFLLIIPFTSSAGLAIALLLCRFSISQMDVPARQTFISLLVSNNERSAANGITNLARSIGLSIGVTINSLFLDYDKNEFMFGMPFIISGGTQMIYDIILALCFLKTSSNIKNREN
jgi:sugar phosphate permease